MSHPSPKNFLHWLQRCQFEVQCCEIQLAAGRPHKQCDPVYVALDEKIANAKLQFNLRVGHIFMKVLSHGIWSGYEYKSHPICDTLVI